MIDFIMGASITVIILNISSLVFDDDFDSKSKLHNRLVVLCKAHESKPLSYDSYDVLCENGISISYRTILQRKP